jgi:hypothetical protein
MAQPSSTGVHNNIDNLILQAKLDEFDKTGIMRAQPEDPRSVADALSRDFVEGLLPIGAGIKLFRGVPKWFKGQMIKDGKYVGGAPLKKYHFDRLNENTDYWIKQGIQDKTYLKNLPYEENLRGLWTTTSRPEAISMGGKKILEFDVPKSIIKEKGIQTQFKGGETVGDIFLFPEGLQKEYLKKFYKGYQQGGSVKPDATKVHNNIDNLILQAELDKLAQTGSMRVDRTPEYIGGVDPVVENVALSPILTLKSIGSVGKKILEKTGLRNPVSHYTTGKRASSILEEGRIEGRGEFPGKPFYGDSRKYLEKQLAKDKTGWLSETDIKFQEQFPKSPSVSITRDPMFLSRPHVHVGSDIGLIMDRDNMIKKGLKIQPFAELNYRKTIPSPYNSPNPRFEFEERVRGNIPTENIKLINALRFPKGESVLSPNVLKIIKELGTTDIPIVKSDRFSKDIKRIMEILKSNWNHPYHKEFLKKNPNMMDYLKIIREFPTYKFDPFKR